MTQQQNNLSLDDVYNLFKGKGGNPESESILNDSNGDKPENIVTVWSNKADAAKIIERCRNNVKSWSIVGDGVQLNIDRKAFRGIVYAFRST